MSRGSQPVSGGRPPGYREEGQLLDDCVEQGAQVQASLVWIQTGNARSGVRVHDRKVDLLLGCFEVDEEVIYLVEHFRGPRILAVDLVDDDDGGQAVLKGLSQDETSLWQGALGGVDKQQHAINHRQRALDLPAEIGVAGRVDDVNDAIAMPDGRVLGHDGDAALALEIDVVECAFLHALVRPEDPGLVEHGVDEGRLAVIDVRDDGDVASQCVGDLRLGSRGHGVSGSRESVIRSVGAVRHWCLAGRSRQRDFAFHERRCAGPNRPRPFSPTTG